LKPWRIDGHPEGWSCSREEDPAIVIWLSIFLIGSAETHGLPKFKQAVPAVSRATRWPDNVKRGEMLREVRGPDSLVSEDLRLIPASPDGLVEKINVRIADMIGPETILAELRNADLTQSLKICAGVSGVLQHLSIDVGQHVAAGESVARLAEPGPLEVQNPNSRNPDQGHRRRASAADRHKKPHGWMAAKILSLPLQ
jgi:multidrug efflux pump subunit AcrA (membrane-fusion protein)